MDLIANSPDEAIIWVTGLTCLISGSRTKGGEAEGGGGREGRGGGVEGGAQLKNNDTKYVDIALS